MRIHVQVNDQAVRFIKKNGRTIPIRAAGAASAHASHAHKILKSAKGAAAIGGAGIAVHQAATGARPGKIKVSETLKTLGIIGSVASGALGAATFTGSGKKIAAGIVGSHVLDAVGTAANIASVAGNKNKKEAAKVAAKQEARNFVIGNAVFAAGVFGLKKNRAAGVQYAKSVVNVARKILRVV